MFSYTLIILSILVIIQTANASLDALIRTTTVVSGVAQPLFYLTPYGIAYSVGSSVIQPAIYLAKGQVTGYGAAAMTGLSVGSSYAGYIGCAALVSTTMQPWLYGSCVGSSSLIGWKLGQYMINTNIELPKKLTLTEYIENLKENEGKELIKKGYTYDIEEEYGDQSIIHIYKKNIEIANVIFDKDFNVKIDDRISNSNGFNKMIHIYNKGERFAGTDDTGKIIDVNLSPEIPSIINILFPGN